MPDAEQPPAAPAPTEVPSASKETPASLKKPVNIAMFVINIIVWILSIVLIALGIWVLVEQPFLEGLLDGDDLHTSGAIIVLFVGLVAFFISFLGCLGALQESKVLVGAYFIALLLIFILVLTGGILGFVFRDSAQEKIAEKMIEGIGEYDIEEPEAPIKLAWDDTQMALKCCGRDGPTDWVQYNTRYTVVSNRVPKSCCKFNPDTDKQYDCQRTPSFTNAHQDGCLTKATDFMYSKAWTIGGIGIAVAIFTIVCMVLSVVLLVQIVKM